MKERIKHILEWTALSQQDFATRLGISPASLSSIFTGRTNPTNNHVQAIHRAFPEINVSWLLFGEGTMMDPVLGEDKQRNDHELRGNLEDGSSVSDAGMMPSMFTDEDYGCSSVAEQPVAIQTQMRRDGSVGRPVGFHLSETAKKHDTYQRKIKEIRVFFDDGTYEAFVPSTSK